MQPGQFDSVTPMIAAIEQVFGAPYWRIAARRDEIRRSIDLRLEIAESAGPWWALDGLAIVSERPLRLEVDDRRRPHCEDGPAIAYGDGWTIHAWHGVRMEPWIVEEPDRITVELIDAQQNAEVRRVMVERFGAERLIREGGAELVSEDEVGRLWRRPLDGGRWPREEPIVMVEVAQLDARARRHPQDLLPARAAANADGPRGCGLDVRDGRLRLPAGAAVMNRAVQRAS